MMHRRTLLASVAGFAAAPAAALRMAQAPIGGADTPTPSGGSGDAAFAAWLADFRARAAAAGWSAATLDLAFAGVTSDPQVTALDQKQPEFSKPVSAYLAGAVSDTRIALGQTRLDGVRPGIARAEDSTGVPAEIMAAIWGIESGYGAVQGNSDVVRSLATLAASGRRRPWAEAQLYAAMTMLQKGDVPRPGLKGSWAGAMGQTQFTPQDYLDYAVDGDGDGRRDIWGSSVDALASTANFLSKKAAWRAEQDWVREVAVPPIDFDYGQVEGAAQTVDAWTGLGVRPADGGGWRPAEKEGSVATLLMPMGWRGPAFLAFPNFGAIRAYNNSISYALAVGLLAKRIGGGGPLVQAWPDDQPLSRDDRLAAQTALVRLGFDPGAPDGVIGAGTRKAAKAWQASRGLPADGYLSYALVQRLKADAGLASPAQATMAPVPDPA